LATKNSLKIGQVDEVQKLHIRSVKLGEMARRIVHHVQSNCFAVLTTRLSMNSFGEESETAQLKMLDDQTFDMMDGFQFLSNETVQSMKVMTFLNDSTQYLIVGTVLYNSNDPEQEEGRLRVFKMSDIKKLKLVHQHDLDGVPYCLEDLQGYLAAGVNSKCLLFDWNAEEPELKLVCRHYGHIIVYKMAVRDKLLAVGDLQKSVCVLQLETKGDGVTLTELARDHSTNWVTAVGVLDEDTFIAAESSRNIYTLSKLEDEEDTRTLTTDGRFHLGEMVNVFKKGIDKYINF
jgi:DNA damage-binding protein 1